MCFTVRQLWQPKNTMSHLPKPYGNGISPKTPRADFCWILLLCVILICTIVFIKDKATYLIMFNRCQLIFPTNISFVFVWCFYVNHFEWLYKFMSIKTISNEEKLKLKILLLPSECRHWLIGQFLFYRMRAQLQCRVYSNLWYNYCIYFQ